METTGQNAAVLSTDFINDSVPDRDFMKTVNPKYRLLNVSEERYESTLFTAIEFTVDDFSFQHGVPASRLPRLIFVNKRQFDADPSVVADLAPVSAVLKFTKIDANLCGITCLKKEMVSTLRAQYLDNYVVMPGYIDTWRMFKPYRNIVVNGWYHNKPAITAHAFNLVALSILGKTYKPEGAVNLYRLMSKDYRHITKNIFEAASEEMACFDIDRAFESDAFAV